MAPPSLSPNSDEHYIVTIAGTEDPGHDNGFIENATFDKPTGMTMDLLGNIYVADTGNHCIRKISNDGWVTTFSGHCGQSGDVDGMGSEVRFQDPRDIAFIGGGMFLVTDTGNNKIRLMDRDGRVITAVGGESGFLEGYAAEARLDHPLYLGIDFQNQMILFSDVNNLRLRSIQPVDQLDDIWTGTVAGGGDTGLSHTTSFTDACEVRIGKPSGLAIFSLAHTVVLYLSDSESNMIYVIYI